MAANARKLGVVRDDKPQRKTADELKETRIAKETAKREAMMAEIMAELESRKHMSMISLKKRLCYGLGGMALVGLGLSGYDSYHAILTFGAGHVQSLQAGSLAIIIDGLLAGSKFGMLFAAHKETKDWALTFVIVAGLASVILNFLEFATTYTPWTGAWFGHGLLGALVPTLVLIAFNFIGHLWSECQE